MAKDVIENAHLQRWWTLLVRAGIVFFRARPEFREPFQGLNSDEIGFPTISMLEIEIGLIPFLCSTHISSCEIFVIFPDIDPYAEYRLKWRVDQPFGSFEITLIKGLPRRVPVFARFPSGNVRLIDEAWYHTAQYGKENLDSPVEIFFNPGSVIRFELVVYSGNRRFNCDMKYHLSVPDNHMDNTNFHIAAKRKGERLPLNVPWMVGSELRSRIQRNYHLFEQDRPANDSK